MLYIVTLVVLAADQLIKWSIRAHMTPGQAVPVVPQVAYILYTQNSGGAFSILEHARWLFVAVALAVVIVGIYVDRRFRLSGWSKVALGLVLGGALGNMADRAVTGLVTDYVYLKFINFPVFNLADACIDAGIAMWLIRSLRADRHRSEGVIGRDE